ncbi:di-heme oxidoredictase family protein [Massilia sp. TN1-12]|uniref:di-heme oxidoredictase family protein n=1 Tax=Massilia paldalensis TaxID=3377675 RepID=UPI00384B87CB
MPYRHQTKQQHRSGAARRVPLALAASLTALLAACGSGSSDSGTQAGSMTRTASKMAVAETVLTPVDVSATGEERGDLSAKAAVDNDDTTRWSSGFTDDQSLVLDFGASKSINRVRINWENAHAIAYELQVSDDKVNWKTIKSVSDSAGGIEDFSDLDGQGRYLRMHGIKRSTQYGYSIFEIQAFSGTSASTPTSPDPLPGDVDLSKPGVAVKPVTAFSSGDENPANDATKAIDGNTSTRWSSTSENGAWITFDFGQKTPVGYMKLVWENAYGKEYELQVSDDGQSWTKLRTVSNGTGGTEEFFNLNANARYVRIQGVARATAYGYSLFEVEFKSPGSDNTLPNNPTSAFKFPASGSGMTPLPAAARPTEMLQFTLPDGTLVTRYGARAMARHGRERGEAWNEAGYGLNETVDLTTGLPVDKGPGNYLTFVPEYFQNRTWGVEIIDNSNVKGVTNPQLIINNYNQVEWKPGQTVFVRGWDRPDVTDYGWMTGPLMADNNVQTCKPMAYPADGVMVSANGINNGCTMKLIAYPQHGEIDTAGFPTGKTIPARALVPGDEIEIAPSMFAQDGALAAIGDKGNSRYYGPEIMYVMGKGILPYYGTFPRLNSTPLPASTLSGGTTSVSYNYSDNSLFMFQQPVNNVGMQDIQRFVEGRRVFHANFTTGAHNEPGNDPYLPVANLQGGHFNQSSCFACHTNNGRSPAPIALNQKLDSMAVRAAVLDANGNQVPHPQYGTAIQMNGSSGGGKANWGTGVRVGGFDSQTVKLADGTAVELRKPKLAFEGPVPQIASLRAAQPMIGMGLLEAVPEADILARVRTTADADGVKGTANFVFDPESGAVRLGRFGWKASKATLRHQSAESLLQEMGVTSSIYPNRACLNGPTACASGGAQAGISEADLQRISQYLALVAVPAQRSLASGFPKGVAPMDEHRVDPTQVAAGAKLFDGMRCTACHTAEMKTGNGHLFAELRNQTIHPYTDLLVHDMGDGLADKFAEGQAKGNMWRTAPLWGIGYTDKVMGNSANVGYLHDGRARNLTEAVMWHGGEATTSRNRFAGLSKTDRDALLAFLRSL